MHILIVPTEYFDADEAALSGIFQRDLLKYYVDNGHNVGVINYRYDKASKRHREDVEFEYLGCPVLRKVTTKFFPSRFLPASLNFLIMKKGFKELYYRYTNKYGVPDLIHCHNLFFAGLSVSGIEKNVKIIITEHQSSYYDGMVPINLLKNMDSAYNVKVTSVSESLKSVLRKVIKSEITVIPNPLPKIFSDKELNRVTKKKYKFITISRMVDIKNVINLTKAFIKYVRNNGQGNLCIVGEGPLKSEVINLIKVSDVQERVCLLDHKTRSELVDLYDSSEYYVLPSKFETFGVVAIEALARGIPVLSTNCGGPEGIVDSSNGMFCGFSPDEIFHGMNNIQNIDFDRFKISTDTLTKFSGYNIAKVYEGMF